jgi:ATPase subunit of ABC transporter with duplicated ATPase domains
MGKDDPDIGVIKVGDTVNMIGVGQDRMEELNPEKTFFEEITGSMDEIELGTTTVNSRAYVSWFGFKGAQQQQIVGNLSGGERNRVQLAKLLKSGANLIILDEPTVRKTGASALCFRNVLNSAHFTPTLSE